MTDQITHATTTAAEIRGDMSRPRRSMGAGTPAPTVILTPTPQEEIDRLLAAGANARGVVIGSRHDMSDGNRSARTRVHVVRPRLTGGALGEEVVLGAWVGWREAALLEPGLEIPVRARSVPDGGHGGGHRSPRS